MKHLVLVGFMGCGKTTVGRKAALRLKLPFVDTDALIVERAGMSIPELFKQHGEAAFRDLETSMIREVSDGPPAVIATGGGALLRPENVDALRRSGILIHLEADPATVLLRTGSRKSRPLLDGYENPLERIQSLMEARKDLYAQADVSVDTVGPPMSRVATAVIDEWRRLGGEGKDEGQRTKDEDRGTRGECRRAAGGEQRVEA